MGNPASQPSGTPKQLDEGGLGGYVGWERERVASKGLWGGLLDLW